MAFKLVIVHRRCLGRIQKSVSLQLREAAPIAQPGIRSWQIQHFALKFRFYRLQRRGTGFGELYRQQRHQNECISLTPNRP